MTMQVVLSLSHLFLNTICSPLCKSHIISKNTIIRHSLILLFLPTISVLEVY